MATEHDFLLKAILLRTHQEANQLSLSFCSKVKVPLNLVLLGLIHTDELRRIEFNY